MSDNLSPQDRRKTMRAVRGKRTSPERRLFSMLAGMGLRGWRQNAENITGKPDVAFDNLRIAVFVDGCFWHGCPYCKRKLPATNRGYWKHKINRNKELAKSHTAKLRRGGWIVIRIWEHEIRPNQGLDRIRIKLAKALGFRGF